MRSITKFLCPVGRIANPSCVVALIFTLLATLSPVRAASSLRDELAVVADGMAKALKEFDIDAIAVGEFSGPPHWPSSGGPVIAQTLIEELQKHHIAVKRVAPAGVKGEYIDVKDKDTGLLAAQIKGTVSDRTGKVLFTFNRGVFGDTTLASIFGTTVHLPPDKSEKHRSEILEKSLDKPQVFINGSVVASTGDSPYGIEVLVSPYSRGKLQPRAARQEDGLAFVPIRRGEVYGVRLINRTSYEAAVNLTIDGLNMFTFSQIRDPKTGRSKSTVIILDPNSDVVIRGWHRTNTDSQEFLVTEYAKSAAAVLHSSAKVGTVTATFAACWPKDGTPPPDEPVKPKDLTRSVDATALGAHIKQDFVQVVRNFGVVRDTVSVRYAK